MYSLNTAYANCWIGLNDLETEGTWVWADGSDSTYRHWAPNEPNDSGGVQDCGCTWIHRIMDDCNCWWSFSCYFCTIVGELHNIIILMLQCIRKICVSRTPVFNMCVFEYFLFL